jgi:hypothetical protein
MGQIARLFLAELETVCDQFLDRVRTVVADQPAHRRSVFQCCPRETVMQGAGGRELAEPLRRGLQHQASGLAGGRLDDRQGIVEFGEPEFADCLGDRGGIVDEGRRGVDQGEDVGAGHARRSGEEERQGNVVPAFSPTV